MCLVRQLLQLDSEVQASRPIPDPFQFDIRGFPTQRRVAGLEIVNINTVKQDTPVSQVNSFDFRIERLL